MYRHDPVVCLVERMEGGRIGQDVVEQLSAHDRNPDEGPMNIPALINIRRATPGPKRASGRGVRDSVPRQPSPPTMPRHRYGTAGRTRRQHPVAGRLSLGQDDVPWLPAHGGPKLGVQRFDVQIARLIRAGFDLSELYPGLGQPSSQVRDHIGDRPVGVAVVAGPDDVRLIE